MYEPQEDSFLLQEAVRKHAKGVVLDVGTGSGIQAVEAVHSGKVKSVVAVDIDREAIAYCRKTHNGKRHKKVKWLVSDLFLAVKNKKFDTIIFNAPYLPADEGTSDIALIGGREGHEVIARFLKEVIRHLKPKGKILLAFSSLTPHIPELLSKNLLIGKEIAKKHIFFEDLLVYLIERHPVLEQIEKKVKNVEFFAKGKRGLVFIGRYKDKKVAIKVKNPDSAAHGTIALEAGMLKEVNKHKIGPKYLFHNPHFLVYEFAEGTYVRDLPKNRLPAAAKKILMQCFILDKAGINKQEMTRPLKHAIVGKKVTLIDFERARKTESAHNVTQMCQFIGNHLGNKKKWIELGREYSENRSESVVKKMLRLL